MHQGGASKGAPLFFVRLAIKKESTMTAEAKTIETECAACTGTGSIDVFNHYASGVCFTCKGSGIIWLAPSKTPAARAAEIGIVRDDAICQIVIIEGGHVVISRRTLAMVNVWADGRVEVRNGVHASLARAAIEWARRAVAAL